ncbi:MAG TPA: response regulator [Phycisphaerae bacterium]|nr:response regulator [Phycisphaerae bacterium]HRY68876.1 response regulator [Phycisphaerae bacterium]HSA25703.1 response regulator [Phycisphaerae bacterium]
MAGILVVDDERGYREELASLFSLEGYEVAAAGSGSEAIEIGVYERPEVLVADWMLKGQIHGLHVAEVLRMVRPDIRAVLITGFSSRDLREQADRQQVSDFVEKPFDQDRILGAVTKALQDEPPKTSSCSVAVVEVGSDHAIRYANSKARGMFAETLAGSGAESLERVLATTSLNDLAAVEDRWVRVAVRGRRPLTWLARARARGPGGRRLMVLLDMEQQHCQHYPSVGMLLGLNIPAHTHWPFGGRALIVDREPLVRRMFVTAFEHLGCTCHAAATAQEALQLYLADDGISVTILDYDVAGEGTAQWLQTQRGIRPCTLIGTSAVERGAEFAALGVEHFLPKPFTVGDVVEMLTRQTEQLQ